MALNSSKCNHLMPLHFESLLVPAKPFVGKTGFLHQLSDWLKWPIMCWLGCRTLLQWT